MSKKHSVRQTETNISILSNITLKYRRTLVDRLLFFMPVR